MVEIDGRGGPKGTSGEVAGNDVRDKREQGHGGL